jgi:hypothetical protein
MTAPTARPARRSSLHRSTTLSLAAAVLATLTSSACRHTPGEATNPVARKVSDPRWHPGIYDPGSRNFRMGIR